MIHGDNCIGARSRFIHGGCWVSDFKLVSCTIETCLVEFFWFELERYPKFIGVLILIPLRIS